MTKAKTKNQLTVTAEKGKQELFMIREFDAPRELVFKAFVDPKLYIQWCGPRHVVMTIDYMDCKTRGAYRFTHADQNGKLLCAFNGVYHEVAAPERIIQTSELEGLPEPGHPCLEYIFFEELEGGRTKVIMQDVFRSVFDRDMAAESGMESGVAVSYERLDEILGKR